ncbi:uncharacterized protein [Primulina eburnea]|uniref:uncharacterized protein n=1 Tax=Primulina eburnea TaxID=1245227 RepID=UPI003C6BF7EC
MANGPNFNYPMYINPSDTLGMNLVSDQLVGTENYGIWSRAMLIALQAKNKIGFIDGTCKKPEAGSALVLQWERCNALVLSWILNTVSREIFGGIVYATNASVVWTDLKEQFNKVNGSRIFALHRDIGRLVQGQNTISHIFASSNNFGMNSVPWSFCHHANALQLRDMSSMINSIDYFNF